MASTVGQGAFAKLRLALEVMRAYRNWHMFALDHFGVISNREVTFILRNGIKFVARAGGSDAGIINEIFLLKRYTPRGNEIQDDDVVIDIGGHIGIFTTAASRAARNVAVYAYEPFPPNHSLLQRNVLLNRLSNVHMFPLAIAGEPGTRTLSVDDRDRVANTLVPSGSSAIQVECVTLQHIFESNHIEVCGFLKMDCEGTEYEILENTPRQYFERTRRISIEFHPNVANQQHSPDGRELVQLLERNGLTITAVQPPSGKEINGHIHATNNSFSR